jgi:hypothetical protein
MLESHVIARQFPRTRVNPLYSVVRIRTSWFVAKFDSSLSGSGVILYARDSDTEVVLGVSTVDLRFLGFGFDSSNHNLAEYIGAVIEVLGQVMLGYSGRSLALEAVKRNDR